MKKIIKLNKMIIVKVSILAIVLCGILEKNIISQAKECSKSLVVIENRTDDLDWKYKVEDGKIYKRLYNYTKNRWETDWELVG